MEKLPRHRPQRDFPNAKRIIFDCDLCECIHCGSLLAPRKPWHMSKTVQTMNGPVFVAGKSKTCVNESCSYFDKHYYASGVLKVSLPYSTYGLDVLAFIGWQHEQENRQLVEIQRELNQRGILINERTVGKAYRQFLALLGGMAVQRSQRLADTSQEHGGLIWAVDALQPEGHGTLLYVLYEVLSGTVVSAIQLSHASAEELKRWLSPYQELPYPVLATLSDGEEAIIAALSQCWPQARHQRCQSHFLSNLSEPILELDTQLRASLRTELGGLPSVPEDSKTLADLSRHQQSSVASPFLPIPSLPRDPELIEIETQIRACIRDALNRPSRKPFFWGGLAGYRQLEALAQALHDLPLTEPGLEYLHRLSIQVERTLDHNRWLAQDIAAAHDWLKRIAQCLHYPFPGSTSPAFEAEVGLSDSIPLTSGQVRQQMEALLRQFQPNLRRQPAQAALHSKWHRLWKTYGTNLLHCYDIPGLPPDNLQLEAVFGRLRRHTRRISGRKSTRELRDFGQYQVLLTAESEADLLAQMQQVSLSDYQTYRRCLAEAEAPHRLLRQLHRNPLKTMRCLVNQHAKRRGTFSGSTLPVTVPQKQALQDRTSTSSFHRTQALKPVQLLHTS